MVLDDAALLDECDNDMQLLGRMVEMFDRDSRQRIIKLSDGIQSGDAEAVKREAHALKGSVGTFFAEAAYDTTSKLEMMGTTGDLSEAAAAFQTLRVQLEELRSKLLEVTGS